MGDTELLERLPAFRESILQQPPTLVREVRGELERLQSVQRELELERRQQQQRLEKLRPERDLLLATLLGTFHVSAEEGLDPFCEQALELVARLARAEAGMLLVRLANPSGRPTERLFLRRCSEADEAFIRHQRYFPGGFLAGALERTGPELLDPTVLELELRRLLEARQVKRALLLPLPRPHGMSAPALLYLENVSREDAFASDLPLIEAWSVFVSRRLSQLERMQHERTRMDATLAFRVSGGLNAFAPHLDPWRSLVGRSQGLAKLLEQMEAWRIARPKVPLLLVGESGSGFKTVAQALHAATMPAGAPFLVLDCGLESGARHELLLSGTLEAAPGLLEQSSGGTLLVHGLEHLSGPGQRVLQHVLQERRYSGVKRGPLQLMVSAHHPLRSSRTDLFDALMHQLSGYEIKLPSLRARQEDIYLLSQHFLAEARTGSTQVLFHATLIRALEERAWPGNVRELRDTVFRLVKNGAHSLDGRPVELGAQALELEPAGAPALIGADGELPTWEEAMERTQRELLKAIMSRTGGNVSKAARHLGISRQHLNNRLNALSLDLLKRSVGDEDV